MQVYKSIIIALLRPPYTIRHTWQARLNRHACHAWLIVYGRKNLPVRQPDTWYKFYTWETTTEEYWKESDTYQADGKDRNEQKCLKQLAKVFYHDMQQHLWQWNQVGINMINLMLCRYNNLNQWSLEDLFNWINIAYRLIDAANLWIFSNYTIFLIEILVKWCLWVQLGVKGLKVALDTKGTFLHRNRMI